MSEIIGRIAKEKHGYEGVYVCGEDRPQLKSQTSHAWFEVSDFQEDFRATVNRVFARIGVAFEMLLDGQYSGCT